VVVLIAEFYCNTIPSKLLSGIWKSDFIFNIMYQHCFGYTVSKLNHVCIKCNYSYIVSHYKYTHFKQTIIYTITHVNTDSKTTINQYMLTQTT